MMSTQERPKAKNPVVLSDHVNQRCREAGIHPNEVKRAVAKMPNFTGTLKWKVPGKFAVVVSKQNGVLLVITVIAHAKQDNHRRQSAGWFASTPRFA